VAQRPAEEMGWDLEEVLGYGQELAGLGSWELDLRTGTIRWSDQSFRILGLEPGDGKLPLDELLEFIHPDDRGRIQDLVLRAPELGDERGELHEDFRVVRADGTLRDVRARAVVRRDPSGAPERWLGITQDVTDQRLAEQELQALYAVTQALREWEAFEPGVMELLRLLAGALGYPMAALWVVDEDQQHLTCRGFWHSEDVDPGPFEDAKRQQRLAPGEGTAGRAWRTSRPVITEDIAAEPAFRPREAALQRGIRSALDFPAIGPAGPVAVLSFFSLEHRVLSDTLVRTLVTIGQELGRFLDSRRAELRPSALTEREAEILRCAAAGNSGPQIARLLSISPETVKTHFEHIYEKLGVTDRAAAVAQALRSGAIR
jgi:PAS domain S-box-containing protein